MVTIEEVNEQRARVVKELKEAVTYLDNLIKPGELPDIAINRRLCKYRMNLNNIKQYEITLTNYTIVHKELNDAEKELSKFKIYKRRKGHTAEEDDK